MNEKNFETDDVAGALPEATMDALPERLAAAADRMGWDQLMPVQARAIPYLLARRDAIVQSRTGSGKTGAFMLPILDRVDPDWAVCQALVLVPTRELAVQVSGESEKLAAETGIRTVAVYGGVGYGPQLAALKEGAHIVVGTPGRILDHLMRGALRLDDLSLLIFDEADRMMSMGFYPDMMRIKAYLPRKLNACMFSATFPPAIHHLTGTFLTDPEWLSLSRDSVHVADTQHVSYMVPAMDKDRSLVRIIEVENPTSAIIFCNTRATVHYVTVVLQRFGYDADELTSDLPQKKREKVLDRVRHGTLRFLVATDVAARGIDIAHLSHVFQYEVPEDPESYVHRAGRTGRAGSAGVAITLFSNVEQTALRNLSNRYSIDMEARTPPSDEDVQTLVTERATALLEAKLRDRDKLRSERMRRFIPLAKSLGESDDELALVAMLLDDYYQDAQHAPPPELELKSKSSASSDSRPQRREGSDSRRRRRR